MVQTAVNKMFSDLLLASDQGQVFVLCLLDLIAVFDTVDQSSVDMLAAVLPS